jgi:hypothetical protein
MVISSRSPARSAERAARRLRWAGGNLALLFAFAIGTPNPRAAQLGLPASAVSSESAITAGEKIYREGLLPSGRPLRAFRGDHVQTQGAVAGCVNCHRRSGLGTIEGTYLVPPITAKYLLRSALTNTSDLDMAHVEGYHQGHVPYTDATLAAAIRDGVASDGHRLSMLMPRYNLDTGAMKDLLAYLKQLGTSPVPGVGERVLEFATIVTPDADPMERDAMLGVLRRFFATQREVIAAETRPMKAQREIRYRVTRQWNLHVWEVKGPSDTWESQLHERMAVEPVFAVVSGIGRATWEPVHRFCESEHVPCLFPNIDVPVVHESDFYATYFSRGVLLEADLMAEWLKKTGAGVAAHTRLVQVFRHGDIGAAAASALRAAAGRHDEVDRELPQAKTPDDLAAALADIGSADVLVLWLRPDDLKALPIQPPRTAVVLMSGLMGGMEAAPLSGDWLRQVHMSYPIDLPERRVARMNFPYGWFKVQQIPLIAERVQVNTYLACVITSETVGHLFDSFVPEYLIERLEMMVSRRLANAYFPRLGLAPGQRFASKGGYVVHFDEQSSPPTATDSTPSRGWRVIPDTDWTVPSAG